MHKVITFGIPSYNAAKDMDHCITSILEGSNYATDIEIINVARIVSDEIGLPAECVAAVFLHESHRFCKILTTYIVFVAMMLFRLISYVNTSMISTNLSKWFQMESAMFYWIKLKIIIIS